MLKHSVLSSTGLSEPSIVLQRKRRQRLRRRPYGGQNVHICTYACKFAATSESIACGMNCPSAGKARSRSGVLRMPHGILHVLKQSVTINYWRPRSNKRGLLNDVMIQINLSVHPMLRSINLRYSRLQQSFWLVAFPRWHVNISLGVGGVLLIVVAFSTREQDISNQSLSHDVSLMLCSRITKQHIATDRPLYSAWSS